MGSGLWLVYVQQGMQGGPFGSYVLVHVCSMSSQLSDTKTYILGVQGTYKPSESLVA